MTRHDEDHDDFRPRRNDHLVEPVFAGLGFGEDAEGDPLDDEAELEGFHEVVEDEPRGFLLRFIRSAREIMRRGSDGGS